MVPSAAKGRPLDRFVAKGRNEVPPIGVPTSMEQAAKRMVTNTWTSGARAVSGESPAWDSTCGRTRCTASSGARPPLAKA